jgi:hypothetical protein
MNAISNQDIAIWIVSWTGQHEKASAIELSLAAEYPNVTVIYSDQNESDPNFPAVKNERWKTVPNTYFFSQKFQCAIRDFDGKILLLITADVEFPDWPLVARKCVEAFRHHDAIGVWSPSVYHSNWQLRAFSLEKLRGTSLHRVFQTDSVVWALSRPVIDHMRSLDYAKNIYGWGIDTMACMYCHANGLLVAIDESINVFHPAGSGYDQEGAAIQRDWFLSQRAPEEARIQDQLLSDLRGMNRADRTPVSPRRNDPCFCGSGKRFKHCHGAFVSD